jgi:hypothetical protein
MTDGRNFIGIGKIFIDTPAEDWNIPNLHFIVSKNSGNVYEAVNLEFGLVSTGKSEVECVRFLVRLVCVYIFSVINDGNGYKELRETVRKPFMADYWAEYRGIEFDLAETRRDLSHDIDRQINKAIHQTFSEELKKALKQEAAQVANEILSWLSLVTSSVEYKEIRQERDAA